MLIENKIIEKSIWLKEFRKKFNSFSSKIPLYTSYVIVGDSILLMSFHFSDCQREETLEFNLNFTKTIQENISLIKNHLITENYYPVIRFTETKIIPLSFEETQKLIEQQNIDPSEAVMRTKEIMIKTEYRIERIHTQENRVSLRNLKDNKIYLYKMIVPVTILLEQINSDLLKAEKFFWCNSELINCLN